ncbi:ced-6, putative [Pediculus humanus corporis]|uniref:Ced-6, putative n=1 Tax=Pediculus humanus subsp. corporis TaxID=121224 RepID=E0VAE0_PEDHC|nr:ced-6, putative [Pediculus humanus corporis]EEB10346.1 ced-6, putative [Pediculus humanus corporis]
MRNSNLLKWAHPNNNKQNNKNGNPNWIHTPDALQKGHIAYLVKTLLKHETSREEGMQPLIM